MAGTTVFDKGDVAGAFLASFAGFGYAIPKEAAQKVMGFRKMDAVRMLLEELYPADASNDQLIESIHQAFTYNMIRFYESSRDLKPLPFAEEIFSWLQKKGIKRALNTGFTKEITETILRRLHWLPGSTIDYVISSDEVAHGRPYPDMIHAIMRKLNLNDPKRVIKIGDTEVDVEEGKQAGCVYVIAVTTGAYSREKLELAHPDKIIDSLEDLPSIFGSLL